MRETGARSSEWVGTVSLLVLLAAMVAGWQTFARAGAAILAAHAFWTLWREGTARSRLQCGISLPVLTWAWGGALPLGAWLLLAALVTAAREKGWTARLASLLTLVFPWLVVEASKAYLAWLGLWPAAA
ncbi:MAG: hypothetical protein RMI94_15470 [Bryobacterales bacterium]|nr:hypothetical protein [Bryobacteraceae bacterium]MDW8131947.1 hypothetical protein [Bryobacterales bacterium]